MPCVEWIFPIDAHTMRRGGLAMKPVARTQPAKRPVNLLLNEATVQQARVFTRNLSSTVDVLLADYVARQQAEQSVRQQLAAGRAAAAANAGRGDRPAAPARAGQAAAPGFRVGPAAFDDPLGAAGRGQDHAGADDGDAVQCEFIALSAVFSGIKEVREAVAQAEMWRGQGRRTILFVDEIHRFNKAQQDGFLPFVEAGCSPSSARRPRTRRSRSIRRLLSRASVYVLKSLDEARWAPCSTARAIGRWPTWLRRRRPASA
jgi:hypothetical protein